jgi:hypothetical protein
MTLKQMAEQILLRKYGAAYTDDANIDEREVYDLIIKSINALIKTEYTNIHIPLVERYVNGSAIATYDVPVTSDTGAKALDRKCYDFGQFGYSAQVWSVEDGIGWSTEDDQYWALAGQGVSIIVTEVSQAQYNILISGFTLPEGRTPNDLESFIRAGQFNSYIELVNAQEGTPSKFALVGISNLVVGENFLRFDYFWQDSLVLDQDILNIIGETNNILIGSNTYFETIPSIQRCDIKITDTRGRAKITLPAQPISLPHGMGIWNIGNPNDHFSAYIPVQPNEMFIMSGVSHTGLSEILSDQVSYEWYGHKTVVFNKPASAMPSTVRVRLVVVDPEQVGENDLLPIPADYESAVVEAVLNILNTDGPADLRTDKQPVQ